jgi:hypothetical protein
MKVIWEAADIWSGRIVGKKGRSELWTIGYVTSISTPALVGKDYAVIPFLSKDAMAQHLTESGELPRELL